MPIPPLDDDGFLPLGVYECTIDEIRESFGRFQSNEQRIRLYDKLSAYVGELRSWGVAKELYVDGSFVTVKNSPSDVDLIVVAPQNYTMPPELPPASYNVLSRRMVRKLYGFDIAFVPHGSQACATWVEFFQKVKNMPGRQKGILTVRLWTTRPR
jgi:hypothetical protein